MSTGPFVLTGRGGYQPRSAWDLIQLRVRFGQWRKCLSVVTVGSSVVPRSARAGACCVRPSAERFQPLVAVGVDLSSSSACDISPSIANLER